MINYVLLTLSGISFILILIAIIYNIKIRQFEDERLHNSINILIFGLFFLLFYLGIKVLNFLDKSFPELLIKISSNIPSYIQTLENYNYPIFITLFLISLLVAMITLKDIWDKCKY